MTLWTSLWLAVGLVGCGRLDDYSGKVCERLGGADCPCHDDGTCDGQGLLCVEGLCVLPTCPAGTDGCPCVAGGGCVDGLVCAGDGAGARCAEDACPAGATGCACPAEGTCPAAADGTPQICAEGICQAPHCDAGALDCVCLGGGCAAGAICDDGWCVADHGQTLEPPADPKCFTPCRGGVLSRPDGRRLECDSDGLLEGCVGGAVCVRGSCVAPADPELGQSGAPATCAGDAECPDMQVCIDGGCYSDCEVDEDCRGDRVCHRRACRRPCVAGDPTRGCPAGTWCQVKHLHVGHCMPKAPRPTSRALPPARCVGDQALASPGVLTFTDAAPTGELTLTNCSSDERTFTVRKADHTVFDGAGQRTVQDEPLPWVTLQLPDGEPEQGVTLTVDLAPEASIAVTIDVSATPEVQRWTATLEVRAQGMPPENVRLRYAKSPVGQWAGKVYYLANFGDGHLDVWKAALERSDEAADAEISQVGNAFVRRWWGYRSGQLSYAELQSMLTATRSGSWRWPVSREYCGNENAACYPADNLVGFSVYSDDLEASPVPTGVSELDVVMNLRTDADEPTRWTGRIVSGEALQYPSDPMVTVEFDQDPAACVGQDQGQCLTLLRALDTEIVVGGRYPAPGPNAACAEGRFEAMPIPWLVPGFTEGTFEQPAGSGQRWVTECRERLLPYGEPEDGEEGGEDLVRLNLSLAGANPVPDGRSIRSPIRLLDGAMIDGEEMFVLFEQRLPSLFPSTEAAVAHGFMYLSRGAPPAEEEAYIGTVPPADGPAPDLPASTCAPWLLDHFLDGVGVELLASQLEDGTANAHVVRALAQVVYEGVVPDDAPRALDPDVEESGEEVHYLCHMNGYFDAGPLGDTPCPPGSLVSFFTVQRTWDPGTEAFIYPEPWDTATACQEERGICLAGEPCAADHPVFACDNDQWGIDREDFEAGRAAFEGGDYTQGCTRVGGECEVGAPCPYKANCKANLDAWTARWADLTPEERPASWFRPNPTWRCADPDAVSCDRDRSELRAGKTFYEAPEDTPVFRPVDQAINEAFRYKTRFQSRASGASVGFAPAVCFGDSVPYCYDPVAIERIRARIDCMAFLYAHFDEQLRGGAIRLVDGSQLPASAALERFLRRSFSYEQTHVAGRAMPVTEQGFETLNAELLVMLGDEAYTQAFASRFDLAGQMVASFEGSAFEPDGLDLAGGAGFEMYSLYQAAQYYQLVLDRFFEHTGVIGATMEPGFGGRRFIGPESAVSWFHKLIRASSQKARVWSRIALRYHGFNRPGPARRIIDKAYATAYLESIYVSQLMKQVLERAAGPEQAQVEGQIEVAQLTYSDALLEMRNARRRISDEVTNFGFSQSYVPFPALDPGDPNAFERVLDRARQKLEVAAEKEEKALADAREFETDSAAFQSELTAIELDHDTQLGEVCGTFRVQIPGGEAVVYPATPEYAHLGGPRLELMGNPCGLVGNGAIAEALGGLELAKLALEQWRLRHQNLIQGADDERRRIGEQCQRIESFATWRAGKGDEIVAFTGLMAGANLVLNQIDRTWDVTKEIIDKSSCIVGTASDCPTKFATNVLLGLGGLVYLGSTTLFEAGVVALEVALATIEQDIVDREIREECDAAVIDGRYVVLDIMRQLAELELEGIQLAYETNLALGSLQGLRNQALSILASKEEQKRLTIDVEAARNDPNVRIYRNDAVINADRTFEAAVREAYRATRVFEYYTSQTFAARDRLYLVRMVANGDHPLDAYLDELEEAFYDFEEAFGNPDLRVELLSVADDVFQIPRIDRGRVLPPAELAAQFQARLRDRPRDMRGAFVIDFRTALHRLSPLTHNHRVRFIEAELVGTNLGDELGRVYIRQKGDGVGFIRAPGGERLAYSFPGRTAVVDVSFNGERPLSDALGNFEGSVADAYRNERLRDRPLHHSGWQLLLNLEDEFVNRDIDLTGLEDIRIYLWYHDFTEL